ncbi:MAG TPA: hypothetical protein VH814_10800 [Steroidobacteraceae bacterium]|jgi:hypothetical protein
MARPKFTALFVLMSTPVALGAQPDSDTGPDYVYCDVSSEEVVAGTSELVTLDRGECTERLRRFVNETVAEVRSSYQSYFDGLGANPEMLGALSRLIARRDLLSTGWMSRSEPLVGHGQSESDAALIQQTNSQLQQLLTQNELESLEKYRQSLPTRELLRPVISRLQSAGLAPSREQLEDAVANAQSWVAGLVNRAHEDGGDDVRSCEDANAFANRRDAQLLAILTRSLDEKQASVAGAYFRERADQRAKDLANYYAKAGHAAPCSIVQINRAKSSD